MKNSVLSSPTSLSNKNTVKRQCLVSAFCHKPEINHKTQLKFMLLLWESKTCLTSTIPR